MKTHSVFSRLLSFALALLTASACFVALPLSASAVEDLNTDTTITPLSGPSWEIDLDALPEGGGAANAVTVGDYSLYKSSTNLRQHTVTLDGVEQTLWGLQGKCASLVVADTTMNLASYQEFTYSVDLYFDEFPSGTRDGSTADEMPLSLVKWMTTKSGATASSIVTAIRVNTQGEICTANTSTSGTGVFLPEDQWFTLSVTYRPAEGFYAVSIDGDHVFQSNFTALSGFSSSKLYLLDGYFSYTTYVKNVRVSTSNRIYWSISTNPAVSWQKDGTGTKYPTAVINSSSVWKDVEPEQKNGYSLYSSTIQLKQYADPANAKQKVWGFQANKGTFFFCDDDNRLVDSASFTVSADLYFDEFPSGSYSDTDTRTPNDYPLSLLKWRVRTVTGGAYHHNAIRVNANGELCTAADSTSGTNVFLPKDEWFHITLTISPSTGRYEICIDGTSVYIGAFSSYTKTVESAVGFFDGYFQYTAYVRDPSIITNDSPNVGVIAEDTADYFGYQTKKNDDGTFDIRVLSAIDPAAFSATGAETSDLFASAGYEVTAVWRDENGEIQSRVHTLTADAVYERVTAANGTFSLPDGDYIHAFIIRGVDPSLSRIEFAIRPYTDLQNGSRRYGAAATLLWNGEYDAESGLPILSRIEQTSPYKALPSDDTFISGRDNVEGVDETQPNGESSYLKLRQASASANSYNRTVYMKFPISETGADRIGDANRILLRFYANSVPLSDKGTWTDEEKENGGILMHVKGASSDWDEDTLCYADTATYPLPTVSDVVGSVRLVDDEWFSVDVTDYVKNAVANGNPDGAVSFCLAIAVPYNAGGDKTVQLSSSESTNSPELLIYPALYAHEVDLPKYNNVGYEPWSYAEEIVNEWIAEGYKNTYTAGDVQWHLDFDEMSSCTDNGGSTEYTVTADTDYSLAASPTDSAEKVLSITDNAGSYEIVDTNKALANEDSFSIEMDMYLTGYPYGGKTTSDPTSANADPLNLVCWMPTEDTSSLGIRLNADGELCTAANSTSGTGVYLPKDEWFHLRLDLDRVNQTILVYLNGVKVVERTDLTFPTASISKLCLLDDCFKYSLNIKDVRVYGHDGYDTPDLTEVENTVATGAYTTPIHWRASQAKGKINEKIYVRSIASLASVEGYDAASVLEPVYDAYGGISNAGFTGTKTGFFHTEIISGRTFIIDPLGNPYFAVGMNTVELGATDNQEAASLEKYGTAETFYSSVATELSSLGINTVWGGDWQELIATEKVGAVVGMSILASYMSSLKLSNNNSAVKFKHNNTMNVFDPDFITYSVDRIKTYTEDYTDDPRILGWTTDNEISAQETMLYDYLTIDATAPENAFSYAVAWTFLRARTGKANPSPEDITEALSEEFKALVYDRYYQVMTKGLKEAGVKQMYLGNRIHNDNRSSEGYLRAASQYVDILTVNLYGGPEPPVDTIEYMYRYSGKPILVTEFYAKAQDATDMNGIPLMNQTNAGWVVETQEDRAAHYENYVMLLLESRCCVGWTWYRFRDNDQRVYQDADGNLYVDHDVTGGAVSSYVKVGTLNADGSYSLDPDFLAVQTNMDLSVEGDPYLPFVADVTADQLTTVYKGEYGGDNSNNGSNKGLYDNDMNIYEPLADAYARVDKHIMGLVNYFDAKHAASATE